MRSVSKSIKKQRLNGVRSLSLVRQHLAADHSQQGFMLPIALGLGFAITLLGITALVNSQSAQTAAAQRRQMGSSLLATEGGVARTLTQLTQSNNAPLLALNYDTINPTTGKTYLGPDGIANNGDEETATVDEWSSYTPNPAVCGIIANTGLPDMSYGGTIGANGQYTLRAYRYNPSQQTGTFLVEGRQGDSTATVAITLEIGSQTEPFPFPGVLSMEKVELLGRKISGSNGNLFYDPALSADPTLVGAAAVGDPNRPDYLNAIKSGSNDGFTTDNVSGTIVACQLTPTLSYTAQGSNLGSIDSSTTLSSTSGSITSYQINDIQLQNNETITVDTTNGPVYLYVDGPIQMIDNTKIRNIRTDGQPPRVGDLRILLTQSQPVQIQDAACVEMAFIYSPLEQLQLLGKADGCPSLGDSIIDGVVWAKEINQSSGDLSGISVPDDVSSLADILTSVNLPNVPKLGRVKHWQRVQL